LRSCQPHVVIVSSIRVPHGRQPLLLRMLLCDTTDLAPLL
jgi:hypothetical protein